MAVYEYVTLGESPLKATKTLTIRYVQPAIVPTGLSIEVESYPHEVQPGRTYSVKFKGVLNKTPDVPGTARYIIYLRVGGKTAKVADSTVSWPAYRKELEITATFRCPDFRLVAGTYDATMIIELEYTPSSGGGGGGHPPGIYPY